MLKRNKTKFKLDKHYCEYYSQGIVVFLVGNGHVDSKLYADYNSVEHPCLHIGTKLILCK